MGHAFSAAQSSDGVGWFPLSGDSIVSIGNTLLAGQTIVSGDGKQAASWFVWTTAGWRP